MRGKCRTRSVHEWGCAWNLQCTVVPVSVSEKVSREDARCDGMQATYTHARTHAHTRTCTHTCTFRELGVEVHVVPEEHAVLFADLVDFEIHIVWLAVQVCLCSRSHSHALPLNFLPIEALFFVIFRRDGLVLGTE
jgi:hypothetical protein